MEAALTEIRAQVQALQHGKPAEVHAANACLVRWQRDPSAAQLCAHLLEEALRTGDVAAAFFSAQTLAANARIGPGGGQTGVQAASDGRTLVQRMVVVLQAVATRERAMIPGIVVTQLCVALSRLAVWLYDDWPSVLEEEFQHLSSQQMAGGSPAAGGTAAGDLRPLLELLEAVATEPFSSRLLVDGSKRSRFLLALRNQVPRLLAALGAAAASSPGPLAMRCTVAWLRALRNFETWLPMVGLAGGGEAAEAALSAAAPAVSVAVQAANLQLGFEAFESSVEVLDAAIVLVSDPHVPVSQQTVVPLVGAFAHTCSTCFPSSSAGGPHNVQSDLGKSLNGFDRSDVAKVLISVLQSAFTAPELLLRDATRHELLAMGTSLLKISSFSSGPGLDLDSFSDGDTSFLERCMEAWEILASSVLDKLTGHTDSIQGFSGFGPGPPGSSAPSANVAMLEAAANEAFQCLLSALPVALMLNPAGSGTSASGAEALLARRASRVRAAQTLICWCTGSEPRTSALLAATQRLASEQPCLTGLASNGAASSRWSELELSLLFASLTAEVLAACSIDAGGAELPEPLRTLFNRLPHLPLGAAPEPWPALLAAAAMEVITSLDPWISPQRCPLESQSTRDLLSFVLDICTSSTASAGGVVVDLLTAASVDATIVVIANLAPLLVKDVAGSATTLERLSHLCFGASGLSPPRRERLVKSALGTLLSQLPPDRVGSSIEAMAAPLRAAAPMPGSLAGDAAVATRLLLQLLAAPEAQQPEMALAWVSSHWQWFLAAFASDGSAPEAVTVTACHSLTAILAQARRCPMAKEAMAKAAAPLAACAMHTLSAQALSALSAIVRISQGGATDEALASALASPIFELLCRLVAVQPEELPPDFLAALLEVISAALAPRCTRLAPMLLQSPNGALSAAVLRILPVLPLLRSPRALCWGFVMLERLPHWSTASGMQPQAAQASSALLDAAVPVAMRASCELLATSPLALDGEVASALARMLQPLAKSRPQICLAAIKAATEACGIPDEEGQVLAAQVADPVATDDMLADLLRDSAEAWQAEHLRRAFMRPASG